jgi:hypothetical protein
MIRYYLPDNYKTTSICLEGFTINKSSAWNNLYNFKIDKLDNYVKNKIIYMQELDISGIVLSDTSTSNSIIKEDKKDLTINSDVEDIVITKKKDKRKSNNA